MDERLNMSNREVDRLRVIHDIIEGKQKWREAAEIMGCSERQVARLCAKVRKEGNRGIIHRLRGKPSNNQLDPELLEKALSAAHDPLWEGFGPTFAQQKLEDWYGIVLSAEKMRQLMSRFVLWRPRRRKTKHRARRERRQNLGMLIQLDGSPHDWFEGRGPKCVLVIFIDDATSRILYGEFVEVEDTRNLMRVIGAYIRRCGRPGAFYVDRHSSYRVNRQATVDEELQDKQKATQITRAMEELGIRMIFAWSPQAKGRVERGFDTHQDRLIKEMRLRGICDMKEANRYLRGEYIPDHNRRYAVEPADPKNVHRPLLRSQNLSEILSIQEDRQIHNDFIVRYENRYFQLQKNQPVRIYPKAEVRVQERLDGSFSIVCKGRKLKFRQISEPPRKSSAVKPRRRTKAKTIAGVRRVQVDPFYAGFTLQKAARINPPASDRLQG
jgi:transposase